MAIVKYKPVLINTQPIDVTIPQTLNFTYSGATTFSNAILSCVFTAADGTNSDAKSIIVTDVSITGVMTFGIGLTVGNMNELGMVNRPTADGVYHISVRLTHTNNDVSMESEQIGLYCLATPVLSIDTLDENGQNVVAQSMISYTVIYTQDNDEPLNSYRVYLYDYTKTNVLMQTDSNYDIADMSAVLTDLEDTRTYYVQVKGVTLHNLDVSTPLYRLYVSYKQAKIYGKMVATNVPEQGSIVLTSNAVALDAELVGIDYNFVDWNGGKKNAIALGSSSKLVLNDDTAMNGDVFTIDIFASVDTEKAPCTLFSASDVKHTKNMKLELLCNYIDDSMPNKKYYFQLSVDETLGGVTRTYVVATDMATELDDLYEFIIQRSNYYYGLVVRTPV